MPAFPRLLLKVPTSKEQTQAVTHLMDAAGLCICGRYLKPTDAKLCLAQVNTSYFPEPTGRNMLVIAAYCFDCSTQINSVFKSIRNRFHNPEPDKYRHDGVPQTNGKT